MIYPKDCQNQPCNYWLITPNQQTLFIKTIFKQWAITNQRAGNSKTAGNYGIKLLTVQCRYTQSCDYSKNRKSLFHKLEFRFKVLYLKLKSCSTLNSANLEQHTQQVYIFVGNSSSVLELIKFLKKKIRKIRGDFFLN